MCDFCDCVGVEVCKLLLVFNLTSIFIVNVCLFWPQMFGRTIKCCIANDNGRATEFIRRKYYPDKSQCYECGVRIRLGLGNSINHGHQLVKLIKLINQLLNIKLIKKVQGAGDVVAQCLVRRTWDQKVMSSRNKLTKCWEVTCDGLVSHPRGS